MGRYQLVDEIGVGGMARVHLARAVGVGGFEKWVAVKQIHHHLADDDRFIRMFLDEARIAASISHPNVAQVFDVGRDGDAYWMAMEYLHGEALLDLMRVGDPENSGTSAISIDVCAKLIADAADGLHAAHELRDAGGRPLNLIHRDVTPHNLILTYDGGVKVLDFGVAKMAHRLAMTATGTLKGKLAYMSPEQVQGATLDRRADVFALGVVLWELTVGRRLFRVENDMETLSRILTYEVPHPSGLVAEFPQELGAIVMRALERNRDARYGTAREFSRALNEYLLKAGVNVGASELGDMVRRAVPVRYRAREARLLRAAELVKERSQVSIATLRAADAVPGGSLGSSLMYDYSKDDEDAVTQLMLRHDEPLRLPPMPLPPLPSVAAASASSAASTGSIPLPVESRPSTTLVSAPASRSRGRSSLTITIGAGAAIWLVSGAVALGAMLASKARAPDASARLRQPLTTVAGGAPSAPSDAEPPPATVSLSAVPVLAAPAPRPPGGPRQAPKRSEHPGFLTVMCVPACDSVAAGGRGLGPSPVVRAALPPGSHLLTLRHGAKTKSLRVRVASGESTAVREDME
ncbi:MAG: serine/threonine protein kinase [Polyangiaceae bacterium]|nr:serine/threonine protein kinase [Polyangiaceae bacterium]